MTGSATPPLDAAARRPKVLAAMSGGVDSSVATALLAGQGFEVVGSMLRFWPDEGSGFEVCCSPEAAFDARRIADRLDVPFYLLDARDDFERVVIAPFVPAYARGETPNPCVWCNREIKFGAFAERARKLGCDFMATGHFVRRVDGPRGVELHRGRDDDKDQTYFLWALPRWVLPYLLFPLGDLTKAQVREMAVERKLPVAWKPSSSGLCFIGGSVEGYLAAHVEAQPGPVVDVSKGHAVVGEHRGVPFYTIGQKRGLGLWKSHEPRWVVDLDAERNTVLVGPREACTWTTLSAGRANWLADSGDLPARVQAQVRYRQRPEPATLTVEGDDRFTLRFDAPQFAVTIGQSAVVYDGDRLLGGGVIEGRSGQGGSYPPASKGPAAAQTLH
jgi:tRNA-uridine 2-sulfurtransferase